MPAPIYVTLLEKLRADADVQAVIARETLAKLKVFLSQDQLPSRTELIAQLGEATTDAN
jgi:hypothetical protein